MNTKSEKRTSFWKIVIIILFLLQASLVGVALAVLTDKKSDSETLKFGAIELDDTGDNATGLSVIQGETTVRMATAEMKTTIVSGEADNADIKINVKLKDTSQPAYYLVYVDHNGLFSNNIDLYFLSGTTIYATDGKNIYPVGENGTLGEATTSESIGIIGKISGGEAQTLTFNLRTTEITTDKEISCTVYAIQQAKLTEKQAYHEIYKKTSSATYVKGTITLTSYTKISFCSEIPSTVTQTPNESLTATYNNSVTTEREKDLIQVYTSSDNTEIAFVSYSTIMAPADCSKMFESCSKLTSLDLSSFDTSNVTDMGYMFRSCSKLTTLDLSNFDTSKVTNMSSMFSSCSFLTSLDLSNFDTSSVTNMSYMFEYCSSLTSLDLSGWDASKVTNMGSMFQGCSKLTSLDLSNFKISKVTHMNDMFNGCSALTSISFGDNFNTSSVTVMMRMFYNCSSLTSLDVSGFDTSKVTYWDNMFSGAFSNNYEDSKLIIGEKFTYNTTSKTEFTKATLISKTSLDGEVNLYKKDGTGETLITE